MVSLLLCLLVIIGTQCANDYFVDKHISCNNVYSAAMSKTSTEYVTYLGTFENTNDCINACISRSNSSSKCLTYTYHTPQYSDSTFAKQCFGRFNDPQWLPYNDKNINCGQIMWTCSSSMDCSLSGSCDHTTGNCSCNIGWKGYRCNELVLLPANKSSGYNQNEGGNHMSSWGGSPFYDHESASYHLITSEMTNHCGMNSWQVNSRIIDAEATNGFNSKYERKQVLELPFAHEPNTAIGPNGEIVIYFSHYDYGSAYPPCTECVNGTTGSNCKVPNAVSYITSMIYSEKSMNGPWSQPMDVVNGKNGVLDCDDNLSVLIHKNGSFANRIHIH